jgi:hypothetical protein
VPAKRPASARDDGFRRAADNGGAAAIAHGSARFTQDLDIVYLRTATNLGRLAAALADHKPYLRGVPPGLPFVWDDATLARGLNFTLVTSLGDIDLLGEIPGGGTYEELSAFRTRCLCLSLPQLMRGSAPQGVLRIWRRWRRYGKKARETPSARSGSGQRRPWARATLPDLFAADGHVQLACGGQV